MNPPKSAELFRTYLNEPYPLAAEHWRQEFLVALEDPDEAAELDEYADKLPKGMAA